jgi:hypothetical protein
MSLLLEVGSQKSSDGGLVVNDEKVENFAVWDFHRQEM